MAQRLGMGPSHASVTWHCRLERALRGTRAQKEKKDQFSCPGDSRGPSTTMRTSKALRPQALNSLSTRRRRTRTTTTMLKMTCWPRFKFRLRLLLCSVACLSPYEQGSTVERVCADWTGGGCARQVKKGHQRLWGEVACCFLQWGSKWIQLRRCRIPAFAAPVLQFLQWTDSVL